jgi:hypothetical protein
VTHDQSLQTAIDRLSQSDPLIKLLNEVRLGRMKPADPGLRAITESWLSTYRQVLESISGLDRSSLIRLDPSPRLDMLIAADMIPADHGAVVSLRSSFQRALTDARASN